MSDHALPLHAWQLSDAVVQPMRGGTANANFTIVTRARRYILRRRSPRYSSVDLIAFDHALMRHLAVRDIVGPNPVATADGHFAVEADGAVYELHTFVPGRNVVWEDEQDLRIAAKGLRHFHDAVADFDPPVPKELPRDDATSAIRRGIAEIEPDANAEQRHVLQQLMACCDRIDAALPDDAYWALPQSLIHGDFHPGNVLIVGDELALFDLDCASTQARARDLADAMLYICARRHGPFDASNIIRLTRECWLEPERNKIFLDSYGPITNDEERALPWIIAARWIHSRIHGRLKLSRNQWATYATTGILTPLEQLKITGG